MSSKASDDPRAHAYDRREQLELLVYQASAERRAVLKTLRSILGDSLELPVADLDESACAYFIELHQELLAKTKTMLDLVARLEAASSALRAERA
jgi:hypothetical protein